MKKVRDMLEVKARINQGKSVSTIAREMGMDRKTVRKLATATTTPEREVCARPSKLDALEAYLRERMAAGMTNSAVLLAEIMARGYAGKSSILRGWLRQHRRARKGAELVMRFETAPGEQAQVDWADCGPVLLDGCPGRLMAFICVLSYSRMAYVEFTVGRDLGRFLRAHQRAFAALGGVPRTILYDNERTVTRVEREDNRSGPRGSPTSRRPMASCPNCADRIARRPRARSSASSAICARPSWLAVRPIASGNSIAGCGSGWMRSPCPFLIDAEGRMYTFPDWSVATPSGNMKFSGPSLRVPIDHSF